MNTSFWLGLVRALLILASLPALAISPVEAQPLLTVSDSRKGSLATLEKSANDAFWQRDYLSARANVRKILNRPELEDEYKSRCLTNLATCQAQLDEWFEARQNSLEALRLAEPQTLTSADAALVHARCLLMENQVDKARDFYESAIKALVALCGPWSTDLASAYEGLAGCEMTLKNYPAAEEHYKKVAQLDLLGYGADSTHLAWSLMSLNAIETQLERHELADALYKKMIWNFRRQNELRILSEYKEEPDQKKLADTLRIQLYGPHRGYENRESGMEYIRRGIPPATMKEKSSRPKDFYNWRRERVGRERAPGEAFFDPTKPLKGLIVTVHGLGLHGGAFRPFAEQIQHEGFGVVSFDVRGFGSYRNDEIYQQLNLKAATRDIERILTELRADYGKLPFILLGESMGGAIALRITAESPELVDALISSVPSGSRYQGNRTAVKVGFKFLKNKHRQFDIGSAIVEQATANADLRDMWEGDSRMRMKLSATELLDFQKFMGENIQSARKIEKTPVIIFQGFSDNLVKPMGTLAIYQAIANRDKDMMFIGRAEHLIFEEGQFDRTTLKIVVEWISRHLSEMSGRITLP